MSENRSARYISALKQLDQFRPVVVDDMAVCALSGVRVTPDSDGDPEDGGLLLLTFPGGVAPVLVVGSMYLKLKIIESVRLEFDGGDEDHKGSISARVHELQEHLERKHDLES